MHSKLIALLFLEFAHLLNQAVVVALDDVFKVGWAVLHEQHIK